MTTLRSRCLLVLLPWLATSVLAQPAAAPALGAAGPNGISVPIGPASALTGNVAGPRFPADHATNVNPDTHLFLTFATPPTLGTRGKIRIYDVSNNQLVDQLDLSIPPAPGRGGRGAIPARGPAAAPGGVTVGAGAAQGIPYVYGDGLATNTTTLTGAGASAANPDAAQLDFIGGFPEGFHFYPVIINDNVATIYPHHQKLTYGKTYSVQIDPGVLNLADGSFTGLTGSTAWTFTTKASPPPKDAARLVVAADGSGDFNTVQGAVDFTPDRNPKPVTIFIQPGIYEEIVYFRNKANLTFLGADRKKVIVGYPNNEIFNGVAPGTRTNEVPGTYPYHRASFMADNSKGIGFVNLTLHNFTPYRGGQAEALLLMGGENFVANCDLLSFQDTVQFNDSVYVQDSYLEGDVDFLWGRGPTFYLRCELKSLHAGNAAMHARNTAANHGLVFVDCTFTAAPGVANVPFSNVNAAQYPNSELVLLNCVLGPHFNPAGWRASGPNVHNWEYHSTNPDGTLADVSQRNAGSRQLNAEPDAELIANYRNPAFVLGGWTPKIPPIVPPPPAPALPPRPPPNPPTI